MEQTFENSNRAKTIIRTSFFGAMMNIALVVMKMIVGAVTNSIALILDAVNNLGDAFSSVITIVGTKFSHKKPDKNHPFGYGRIEYFTSFIIGIFVLVAGLTSIKEAIKKIINPAQTNYSAISIVLITIAIIVKIVLGLYVKSVGKKISAKTLEDSGVDALMDAVVSFTTLVAAFLNMIFNLNIEGWLGAIISLLVLKSAYEILKDTISTLIGTHNDKRLIQELKDKIKAIPDVNGAYDLILHNYGPATSIGTVHIEVADELPAKRIYEISRKIQNEIFDEYGIVMTVGIYASNNTNEFAIEVNKVIKEHIYTMEHIAGVHGLYINKETKTMNFDVVIDFGADNMLKVKDKVELKMKELYPDYKFSIQHDMIYNF